MENAPLIIITSIAIGAIVWTIRCSYNTEEKIISEKLKKFLSKDAKYIIKWLPAAKYGNIFYKTKNKKYIGTFETKNNKIIFYAVPFSNGVYHIEIPENYTGPDPLKQTTTKTIPREITLHPISTSLTFNNETADYICGDQNKQIYGIIIGKYGVFYKKDKNENKKYIAAGPIEQNDTNEITDYEDCIFGMSKTALKKYGIITAPINQEKWKQLMETRNEEDIKKEIDKIDEWTMIKQ